MRLLLNEKLCTVAGGILMQFLSETVVVILGEAYLR
jgi:hypothetical protein